MKQCPFCGSDYVAHGCQTLPDGADMVMAAWDACLSLSPDEPSGKTMARLIRFFNEMLAAVKPFAVDAARFRDSSKPLCKPPKDSEAVTLRGVLPVWDGMIPFSMDCADGRVIRVMLPVDQLYSLIDVAQEYIARQIPKDLRDLSQSASSSGNSSSAVSTPVE
jgi:hypothetical protein